MKTYTIRKYVLAALAAVFILSGANTLRAHDGQWDGHHHYYRDNYGYWDNNDHYRHYEHWNGHQGYWDTRGSTRVFINVGF